MTFMLLKLRAMDDIATLDPNYVDLLFTVGEFDSYFDKVANLFDAKIKAHGGKRLNVAKMIQASRKCSCANCATKNIPDDDRLAEQILPALEAVMKELGL